MSILKIAHYYQIKLALVGATAYKQLMALQAEANKLYAIKPDDSEIYELTDEQIAELAEKLKPINSTILNLKNKINSLAYHVSQHGIEASSLKFRLDKIKEACSRLSTLGYDEKTAPILSLVNNIQPVDIQTPSKKVIDLDTDKEKSQEEIGAGGAMQPPPRSTPLPSKPKPAPSKSNSPASSSGPSNPAPTSVPYAGANKNKLRQFGVTNPSTGKIEGD